MEQDVNEVVSSMIAEKKVSGQWPLNELFSIFDALTEYDLQTEAKTSQLYKRAGLALLIAIGLAIGSVILSNNIGMNLYPIGLPIASIFLVGAIVVFVLALKQDKLDLRNEFREYVRPLLEHLQDDIKKDSPVVLDLYLSPVDSKQFSKGRSEKYRSGVYEDCRDSYFGRDLLTLKLRLSDGNRFMLTSTELFTETSKTKKTRRGWKTKSKRRKRIAYNVRILVDSEKFSCKKMPTEGEQKFYAKQSNGTPIIGVKFTEKLKDFRAAKMVPDPLLTLQQIVKLYAFLQAKKAT